MSPIDPVSGNPGAGDVGGSNGSAAPVQPGASNADTLYLLGPGVARFNGIDVIRNNQM